MDFPSKLPGASLIGSEELAEITEVVESQSPFRFYGIGSPDKVSRFEEEAGAFLGCRYALAVNSGSSALFCAVTALGIGPGDEVIIPAFTWFSDYTSVLLAGATPVFADIDESLDLDPADFEAKITERTKAVIVVHYQGGPADLDAICRISDAHGISVIEDCAQAFGGEYRGKRLGTYGAIGITSFQGNKMITAGEGGLVYTSDEALFARAVRCHDNGSMRDHFAAQIKDPELLSDSAGFPGFQFRMGELQGAMLLAQIRKLPSLLETCRRHHEMLRSRFAQTTCFEIRGHVPGDCGITFFFRFTDGAEAKRFEEILVEEKVPVGPSSGCVNVLHSEMVRSRRQLQDAFPPASGKKQPPYSPETVAPRTDGILERYVAIGIGPTYTDEHLEFIAGGIEQAIEATSR